MVKSLLIEASSNTTRFNMRYTSSIFSILLLILFSSSSTYAYTVVVRTGQRIEIPDNFVVTRDYLIYEVSKDIRVSIPMVSIDIRATEEQNREAQGSLLKRVDQMSSSSLPTQEKSKTVGRTITNADIEPIRREREIKEREMQERIKELKIPEVKAIREAEEKRLKRIQRERELEEARAEAYWRGRAKALRDEIRVLNSKLGYIRQRLAMLPASENLYPYIVVNRAPLWNLNIHSQLPSFSNNVCPVPQGWPTSVVIPNPYYSNERSLLLSNQSELEMELEGLLTRWELLEEEARRAGALPGWLRE
jgi:hypothetical protein